MKISAQISNEAMLATVVSICDWAISSCSSTGSPVMPTLTPGTSRRVSFTRTRSRFTESSFCFSVGAWAVTRKIWPLAKVTYICCSASSPASNNAVMPGDGGVPERRKLSRACRRIRSRAGTALTRDSFSAFFSSLAVRNCVLIIEKSDARFVVRVNLSIKGR